MLNRAIIKEEWMKLGKAPVAGENEDPFTSGATDTQKIIHFGYLNNVPGWLAKMRVAANSASTGIPVLMSLTIHDLKFMCKSF